MSPLGEAVANTLGDVFSGIYHLSTHALEKVDWSNPHHLQFTLDRELATLDSNHLTILVVLCHDRMLRLAIQSASPRYLRLVFHPRKRDGRLWERCPTLEDHIATIRAHYNPQPTPETEN